MKRFLLILVAVGMIFTACEENGGIEEGDGQKDPTEQPGGDGGNENGDGNGNQGGSDNPGGDNGNEGGQGTFADPNNPLNGITCANNEILYISTTCLPIAITKEGFNVRMVGNTYENGIGRFVFDGEVTNIPDNKFENNEELEYIKLPNSVTSIGTCAFQTCSSLKSVTIPDSVTAIGGYAFRYCSSLTSITIPNSVTSIGDEAFYDCSSLTRVNITDLSAWCKIDFYDGCANPLSYAKNLYLNGELVAELTIPSDIAEIKSYTFYNCSSLTSVTIGDSVTSIGGRAFENCNSLTTFYGKFASADNRCLIIDGVLKVFALAGLTSYTIPDSVTSIGEGAFSGCSGLVSIIIPNSVASIGEGAFSGCSGLASVTILDGVTTIGDYAFSGCSSLASVTIPDGVTTIGSYAFYECSGLINITIPNSVTSVGDYTFINCFNLEDVYCKAIIPPYAGDHIFGYVRAIRAVKIYVPTASVKAYKSASGWSNFASYIVGYDF